MKFSHSIQFNAVPDWSSHYIAYSNLKKLIYQLEKNVNRSGADDPERSFLIAGEDLDKVFQRALDAELEKISSFYQLKELEIYAEVTELLRENEEFEGDGLDQLDGQERTRSGNGSRPRERPRSLIRTFIRQRRPSTISNSIDEGMEDSDDDDDEHTALYKQKSALGRSKSKPYDAQTASSAEGMRASIELNRGTLRSSQLYCDDFEHEALAALYSSGITLKKRTTNLYVQLCELKSFVQLNRTGFTKVLKKYDKTLDRSLKSKYIEESVAPACPFTSATTKLIDDNITKMEHLYAHNATQGDLTVAKKELRLHLREHVVWERNTVWRDMIGLERKAQAANLGLRTTLLGIENSVMNTRLQGDDNHGVEMKEVSTPVGKLRLPAWLFSSTIFTLVGVVAIFLVLLYVPMSLPKEQQNCLAMLAFVSLLWATEVIPLFVTSLMTPFLCVILRVVRSDEKPHHRLNASAATKYIFAAMWTPVIMLLLGGFTIAAALSKYHIAKRIATFVLSKAGTSPRTVLVTNMFVAAFASMWISNVAAPVLCFSIIQPLLRNLPSDSEMSKALLLGIALASNIGGMLSPIASPQNIVALEIMQPPPSWGTWFFVALPVGIISILLIWVVLLVSFSPARGTSIVPIRPVKDSFTGVQWFISLVTLGTIALWCVSHQLEWVFGDMGVIAILPIVLFFGTGFLTKEDFNNFLWTIIILAAGGLSLGKAVNSSGLLHTVANYITESVDGFSLYTILVVFATLILIVATFISHTVAALIILPLVHSVGMAMDEPHPNLLVMGGALMCSAAMGLPTSGFPNMSMFSSIYPVRINPHAILTAFNSHPFEVALDLRAAAAIMMEDAQTGQRYLRVQHFITRGVPSSIITLFVVISVGCSLMYVVGM